MRPLTAAGNPNGIRGTGPRVLRQGAQTLNALVTLRGLATLPPRKCLRAPFAGSEPKPGLQFCWEKLPVMLVAAQGVGSISPHKTRDIVGRNGEFKKDDAISGPIRSVFPETGYGNEAAAGRSAREAQAVTRPSTEARNRRGHRGARQPRSCMAEGPAPLLRHPTASEERGAAARSR